MALLETRGLWLSWVIRGGIGLTRRLSATFGYTCAKLRQPGSFAGQIAIECRNGEEGLCTPLKARLKAASDSEFWALGLGVC